MKTATAYEYVDRFGTRKALAYPWSSLEEKEIAAVQAGVKARKEMLHRALNAMLQAGEIESAKAIALDYMRFQS